MTAPAPEKTAAARWPQPLPDPDAAAQFGLDAVRIVHRERITAAIWNVEHAPGWAIAQAMEAAQSAFDAYGAFEISTAIPKE